MYAKFEVETTGPEYHGQYTRIWSFGFSHALVILKHSFGITCIIKVSYLKYIYSLSFYKEAKTDIIWSNIFEGHKIFIHMLAYNLDQLLCYRIIHSNIVQIFQFYVEIENCMTINLHCIYIPFQNELLKFNFTFHWQ